MFEVIGVYPPGAAPDTFCAVQLGDRQPIRTKSVKVSERGTNNRNGAEVKMCVPSVASPPFAYAHSARSPDVDERTHKFRIGVWKSGQPEPIFLGHVKLELSSLPSNRLEEHTLKIKKSKGKGFAKGGLHFGIEYRPPHHHDEKKRKDNVFGDKFRGFSILSGGAKKHKRVFAQPPDPQRAEVPPQLQVRPRPVDLSPELSLPPEIVIFASPRLHPRI